MTCVPPVIHPRREKDDLNEGFGGATSSSPFGFRVGKQKHQDEIFAAVTRLLNRKEAHRDQAAIEAIKKEGAALLESQTWDQATVVEREDLLAKARAEHDTIHLGELMRRIYPNTVIRGASYLEETPCVISTAQRRCFKNCRRLPQVYKTQIITSLMGVYQATAQRRQTPLEPTCSRS